MINGGANMSVFSTRCQVLTPVTMKPAVFLDVTCLLDRHQCV